MGMGMPIRAGKRMMFICVSASILIIIINLDMMLVIPFLKMEILNYWE